MDVMMTCIHTIVRTTKYNTSHTAALPSLLIHSHSYPSATSTLHMDGEIDIGGATVDLVDDTSQ